ncbi:TPA: response regulator transcription factor [Enterobacter hormaechei subsp. xiangfangensis]|nr:response regulator transcription factor [Enterobacter hormaechei subsp. xiangfangensis]
MKMIFISDNYYLCTGIEGSVASVTTVRNKHDINNCFFDSCETYPVISIENIQLRKAAIRKIRKKTNKYAVMMKELNNRQLFKIANTVYCSNDFPLGRMLYIAESNRRKYVASFTPRELQVMQEMNQTNTEIASQLNISVKTVSSYKIRIMNKLNDGLKNNLVFCKLKETFDESLV